MAAAEKREINADRTKWQQRINAEFDHLRLQYLQNNVQVGNKNHCVY